MPWSRSRSRTRIDLIGSLVTVGIRHLLDKGLGRGLQCQLGTRHSVKAERRCYEVHTGNCTNFFTNTCRLKALNLMTRSLELHTTTPAEKSESLRM